MKLPVSLGLILVSVCGVTARGVAADPDWRSLLKAAPAAQVEWGTRYEHGEGVPQDYGRARQLYCAAARRGHVLALYQLGWMYANGRGVPQDDGQAAAWFRLAAAKGDGPSQRMLARLDNRTKAQHARCADVEPAEPMGQPLPILPLMAQRSLRLPRTASSPPLSASARPGRAKIEALVQRMAPTYGLQPALVLAVIEAESNFNSQARSPKEAQGLMQLIPSTSQRFGVQNPYDPVQNLQGGMAYLRWLLAYFQGDVRLTLAGYNAGEGAVLRYGGIPPYAETRAYVERITRAYGQLAHPPVAPVTRPAVLRQLSSTVTPAVAVE